MEQNKPIPEHPRPVGFFNNREGPVQSVPAKLLTLKAGIERDWGAGPVTKDAWEEWMEH